MTSRSKYQLTNTQIDAQYLAAAKIRLKYIHVHEPLTQIVEKSPELPRFQLVLEDPEGWDGV